MIKVSFIAIVLAAIGYKEYNPSVEGFWRSDNLLVYEMHFRNDSFATDYVQQTFFMNVHHWDYGNYNLWNDTLILTYDSTHRVEMYELIRQNKRKLILQPIDTVKTKKIVYKRIK